MLNYYLKALKYRIAKQDHSYDKYIEIDADFVQSCRYSESNKNLVNPVACIWKSELMDWYPI